MPRHRPLFVHVRERNGLRRAGTGWMRRSGWPGRCRRRGRGQQHRPLRLGRAGDLRRHRVRIGQRRRGAPGGVGGDGGAPTTGAAGAAATCETGCSFQCDAGCSSGPTCVLSSLPAAGGAAGVAGQAGGKGGPGGGGAGGWSCGYYAGGSGSVTVTGASAFSVGDGGAGGSAGAASGVAGTKCPP